MRWAVLLLSAWASVATAETPAASLAPYTVPWQLRPAIPVTSLRLDNSFATYKTTGDGLTTVSFLSASKKLWPDLALQIRVGLVHDSPPIGESGTAITNLAPSVTYSRLLLPELRITGMLGLTIPIGSGGGDSPNPATAAAVRSGVLARFGLDSSMFNVNDLALFPGVDLAWTHAGFTVQFEFSLYQYFRTRGEASIAGNPPANPDETKTSITSGLHVGYFVLPWLSLAGEFRGQRWLTTPALVRIDPAFSDSLSAAAGIRFHFKVGETWFRPGVAYARGRDAPLTTRHYQAVLVDLPAVF